MLKTTQHANYSTGGNASNYYPEMFLESRGGVINIQSGLHYPSSRVISIQSGFQLPSSGVISILSGLQDCSGRVINIWSGF